MAERSLTIALAAGLRPTHQIVKLKGQLCLETVKQFQDTMRAEPAPVVILDMHDVGFLDSAGVGALVNLYVGFERTHRRLGVADASERAKAALQVAGLHRVISTFATVADAEQHFV